ncbi:helix-turn-helix domain-containing protein [Candidatus Kaiserbacteria bacterium]|nr:helix-turn-helix domain-containing protein [Candidatus Kaiserbacteria bacterium]
MNEVVILDGESFISSRRASEISGYTMDHIGYLARRSDIVARRIGGLWYVSEPSIQEYKKQLDEFTPVPPGAEKRQPDPETIVSFDGREYVSVGKAAELTGYHQDYVGQLCREEKILSRQIGRRWYIQRDALLAHKKQKDALLAAVQAESVGLRVRRLDAEKGLASDHTGPLMRYIPEEANLLPIIARADARSVESRMPEMPISDHISILPASMGNRATSRIQIRKRLNNRRSHPSHLRKLATVAATIVIVISVGYASVQSSAMYANLIENKAGLGAAGRVADVLERILDYIEGMVTHQSTYRSSRL